MWSWIVEAVTLAYIALVIISLAAYLPLWTFAIFPALIILGAYAEHRRDLALMPISADQNIRP
ncbi:MAG TPA: hypothetical protein VL500_01685 [Candidatus Eisenbacteria bacterium]|jgi:hypothetical protein|nr:hypothetical protein [Candidatus Eisenbacteria bacterium]